MKPAGDVVERFAAAVSARLGLRVEHQRAADVVERRAAAHHEPVAAYLDRLGDPAELRALVGELTVGETFFFRHLEQLRAFVEVVVPRRLMRDRLRVLSVGCASGEEPYTLAMLLRDAHPGVAFAVHAIDVDANAIARARAARYSRWSLRATVPAIEQRWFRTEGDEAVLAPEIAAAVSFQHGNALDDIALEAGTGWDAVFCRNVIMYFTDDRADALIGRIARALAPGGYLFLGHAETLRTRPREFTLRHTHGAFYYQRGSGAVAAPDAGGLGDVGGAASPAGPAPDTRWRDEIRTATERVHAMVDVALDRTWRAPSPEALAVAAPELGAIHELFVQERFGEALDRLALLRAATAGDREVAILHAAALTHAGRFVEARAACAELLAADPASAGASYLLALACDGIGDSDGAIRLARIAAELDPSFAMPRLHLGLLARRAGQRDAVSRELTCAIALFERETPARLALYGGGFGRAALLEMCRAEIAAIGGAR